MQVEITGKADRKVYLNTPLSVQVVVPRLHDHKLCQVMDAVDTALKRYYQGDSKAML